MFNLFYIYIGVLLLSKHLHLFIKLKKHWKVKSIRSFFGVGINTEEAALGMSETAVDTKEAKGRELLITTEKKEKLFN